MHLRGHFLPTHHACAHWKDAGTGGRIVCTASSSGLLGNFGQTNYGAAKAGIAAFSTIVAMEMARYGVRCNAIAPAARTRMTESAYGAFKDLSADDEEDETFDFWHPDNVAPLVAYLCSDAAGTISGKVFGVQGDAVELYQPFTSVAVIQNHDTRFTPEGIAARAHELFDDQRHQPRGREHDGQAALHDDRARRPLNYRSSGAFRQIDPENRWNAPLKGVACFQVSARITSYAATQASTRHTTAPTRRIVDSRTNRSRVRPSITASPATVTSASQSRRRR